MRIAYIHQYFTTPDQVGVTRSYEMARRLVARGHQVSVVTTDQSSSFHGWRVRDVAGIQVHELAVPYSNYMGDGTRMRSFLSFAAGASLRTAQQEVDVIFATSTPLTVAIPGILASKWRRVPLVFEVRDLWPDVPIALGALRSRPLIWAAKWLEKMAYRHSRRIVALAPGMRDDIIAKRVPSERVVVIPNGCDVDVFASEGMAPEAIRSTVPGLGSGPLVVFAGTIGRTCGLPYLVAVAERMREIAPEVQFVAAGDGSARPAIEDAARRAGLLGVNFFLVGHVSKHVAARWISAADMVVCLIIGTRIDWKDAVQNKFFDAVAAGKPTASNFEGYQSILARDADIGIILEPDCPNAGAALLLEKLRDRAWLDVVAIRSRALARGEFSRDAHAAKLEETLIAAMHRTTPSKDC